LNILWKIVKRLYSSISNYEPNECKSEDSTTEVRSANILDTGYS